MFDSTQFWIDEYKAGRNSGVGSGGEFAAFKARVITKFIKDHDVKDVVEFGSGDCRQAAIIPYPKYTGFDVSPEAVRLGQNMFKDDPTRRIAHVSEYRGEMADLALSLDVLYHLVEDNVFDKYIRALFNAAKKYVIVYSSDDDNIPSTVPHIRHRNFSNWIQVNRPLWKRTEIIKNEVGVYADFHFYELVG